MDEVLTKFCPCCCDNVTIENYSKAKSRKDGLCAYCKSCDAQKVKERTLKRVAKNELKTEPSITEKKCGICKEVFPISNFWGDKRVSDGFRYCCKKCFRDSTAGNRKTYLARSIARAQSGEVTEKKCPDCQKILPLSSYSKSIKMTYGVDSKCKECKAKSQKERYDYLNQVEGPFRQRLDYVNLKAEVFSHYSQGRPRCACCGIEYLPHLTLDHVNRDGAQKRKEGHGQGYKLWKQVKVWGYPKEFQILCNNCNRSSYWNNGICPCKDYFTVTNKN